MPSLFDHPTAMSRWARQERSAGRRIALVPTMGALHAGHVSLIARANELADLTVVSIFVNPLQFGDTTDFRAYPRPLDDDLAVCDVNGVDAIFAPTAAAMYPHGFDTRVVPGQLATAMEGASRPGHFEGVATVVAKLVGATAADAACFGEKDFQQLAVVRRMVADLDMGVDIVGCPTVRDPDGVAMSSRNRRLTPEQRTAARCLPRAIAAASDVARSDGSAGAIVDAALQVVLGEPAASVDYVTLFDAATLAPIDVLTRRDPGRSRLALAVSFGDVRLIDNVDLFGR